MPSPSCLYSVFKIHWLPASIHLSASHLYLRYLCHVSSLPAEKYSLVLSEANSLKSRSLRGKFTNVVSLLVRILDSENRFRSGVHVCQGQTGWQEQSQSRGDCFLRGRGLLRQQKSRQEKKVYQVYFFPTLLAFTSAPCHHSLSQGKSLP